jgi:dipeptidyl aminopeptidase/acylaminoacyl peptidase
VEAAGYSPNSGYQFTQVNADGAPRLELRDAAGNVVALPEPPRAGAWSLLQIYRYGNQPRFSRSERYLGLNVFGGATAAAPHVVDLKSGTARPVADVLPPALRDRAMVAPRSVRVGSFDGRQVPAFLYAGSEATNAPAVILVHGGPTAQSTQRFDPYVQYLASKGYVVLVPNVRGSTGYGKSYTLLDNKDFGGGPLKDVVACKQWLVQNAGVDVDRVVVMGGSYGGYMALAAATFTPREFAANVDWFGVSDLKTLVESFPPYWAAGIEFIYAKFGNPNDPQDAPYLHDRSPLWFADRIERPLFVVQGDKDVRVRQDQSDRIVEVLRKKGVPVHYLILRNEGHGFSRNESRLAAYAATDRFLDRYLFGDTSVEVVPPAR